MASATPWQSSLYCRPLTSRSRFPTCSLRWMPTSSRITSMRASASASVSFTAVKADNVERQWQEAQGLPNGEEEAVKRTLNAAIQSANMVCSKRPYNVQIFVDENESDEAIAARFGREVRQAGILQECRRRRYHETRQDIKKRKGKDAQRRMRMDRARRAFKRKLREENEDDETDDEDDEDDNWELPEEDIGF